jgi:K(+)-stimulated pyrophosphate-energized sodium pump
MSTRAEKTQAIPSDNVHESKYYGYAPVTIQDYPFAEELKRNKMDRDLAEIVDPAMLSDHGRTSKVLLVGIVLFCITFIILVVYLALISGCKVEMLCDTLDNSTFVTSRYKFSTYEFPIPTKMVWMAMTVGVLGLIVSCYFGFSIIRRNVGTPRMAEIATFIKRGSLVFVATGLLAMAPIILTAFVLLMSLVNPRTGGAYGIGALLSAIAFYTSVGVSVRGNVRTAAASHAGLNQGVNVVFRTGAVAGLCVISIGLTGLSAVYLMFEDVHALSGFVLGASTVALFVRIGGGIFSKSSSTGAAQVHLIQAHIDTDDPRNPGSVAKSVGKNVGEVAGMGSDLFESFVGSIVATAILGSALPFVFRDSYAMCVFNHLHIDETCGPFGYPKKLSFATYICQTDEFYNNYPILTVWQSNAAFVALPFLIALVGLLASVIATSYIHVSVDVEDKTAATKILMRSVRANFLISIALVIAGSAAVCFGLFGHSSGFQSAPGMSNVNDLPRFQASSCKSAYLDDNLSTADKPRPQGEIVLGKFRPISPLGFRFGPAHQTSWRLFVCILIGLFLGMLVGFLTEYFTSSSYAPTEGIASAGQYGAGTVVVHGLGIGLLSAILPMGVIIVAILGSYNLFGHYGIALASVGLLSTAGITMTTEVTGPVSSSAGSIAKLSGLSSVMQTRTASLKSVGATTESVGKGFASVSGVMTAYSLLAALVQNSGLYPSPRELIGTTRSIGTRMFGDTNVSSLTDVYVVVSMLIGFMLPFMFVGLMLLAVSRATVALLGEAKRQFREIAGLRIDELGARPDHASCVGTNTRSAVVEIALPGIVTIMAPLVVGFGFGQRALIAMLTTTIGTSYMMGTTMSNAGSSWYNASLLVESGLYGEKNGSGSEWHKASATGQAVGEPFRGTSGPALNVFSKIMTSISLVSISYMQVDSTRGWVGAILFAVTVVAVTVYGLWVIYRSFRQTELDESIRTGEEGMHVEAPPRRVSPFYSAGPMWEPSMVAPGSQMHDAMIATGNPSIVPFDASKLPGMSSRESADISNAGNGIDVSAMSATSYVHQDNARASVVKLV